jgi:long-chain acyl-CoA synthetase
MRSNYHFETLSTVFNDSIATNGNCRCQWWITSPTATDSLSFAQVGSLVRDQTNALVKDGIQKGDRIAIMSNNCPQWLWADFSILNAGGVTVTIYPTSSPREITYIINDSECRFIFVQTKEEAARVISAVSEMPKLEKIIVFQGTDLPDHPLVQSLDALIKQGAIFGASNRYAYDKRWRSVEPSDWATIVYTSGTTGESKGVLHTHHSLLSGLSRDKQHMYGFGYNLDETDVLLSFLPLSHTYERFNGQLAAIFHGCTIAYCQKPSTIMQDLQVFKPTFFCSVPRIFERIYLGLREMTAQNEQSRVAFEKAIDIGQQVTAARLDENGCVDMAFELDPTEGISDELKQQYKWADEIIFSKIRMILGGNLRIVYSASAPFSADLFNLLMAMGLRISNGYGLTETVNSVLYNNNSKVKAGTVGQPAVGMEVRIEEDGELLCRGDNLFLEYFNKPEATQEAFTEDGFFRTGDIVKVDENGYFSIVDRKKAIIVLDTGKKVARAKAENEFSTSRCVEQICLVGDDRKFITALIVPKFTFFIPYLKSQGIAIDESKLVFQGEGADRTCVEVGDDLIALQIVQEMIAKEIEQVNILLEKHEMIKKWHIINRQFTLENDEITPTLKNKVRVIAQNYAGEIEELYQ